MLVATDVHKSYGDVQALRGADLNVERGQIVALLGRNGAGKSTFLSVIAGLTKPDQGEVIVDGVNMTHDPERASTNLGIAPQDTGIYPVLTVGENLEFFGSLSGLGRSETQKRAPVVADQLGLAELLDRKASNLSGGEARRLHTACALMHAPQLLMLDEPTVGADVGTRNQLIEAVNALSQEGVAVIYTTHYLPEVEALGAEVVVIDEGRILARGTQDELIKQHHLEGLRIQLQGELPASLAALDPTPTDPGWFRVEGPFTMEHLLNVMGDDARQLISVETLRPSLETVFLAITGRRLDDDDAGAKGAGSGETEEQEGVQA